MFKSMYFFCYFVQNIFTFFASIYRGVLELLPESTWRTFSACLIVLDNLCEIFRCSMVTDYLSTVFGFSITVSYSVVKFDRFTDFLFFLLK